MNLRTIVGIAAACVIGTLLSTTPCLAVQHQCDLPDIGNGTALLPPEGCTYINEKELHMMVDGLPPGTDIQVRAIHTAFQGITRTPGSPLDANGETEEFASELQLEMTGTGDLAGFNRTITVNVKIGRAHV